MDKLDSKNYRRFFQTLLWLEELQMLLDISSFDIEDAVLKRDRKHRFLALAVPGLAENRPSVLKGDHVYVRVHDANKWYQGVAHHIALEEVHFAFHREFHDRWAQRGCCHVVSVAPLLPWPLALLAGRFRLCFVGEVASAGDFAWASC